MFIEDAHKERHPYIYIYMYMCIHTYIHIYMYFHVSVVIDPERLGGQKFKLHFLIEEVMCFDTGLGDRDSCQRSVRVLGFVIMYI